MARLHLILGGARSGKSALAEKVATQTEKTVVYLATAQAGDDEMTTRIEMHQQQRNAEWQVIEEPLSLTAELTKMQTQNVVILVDCLTLWLNNHLCHQGLEAWLPIKREFIELLTSWSEQAADLILVSNEVGHGIVPMGELSRQFVDESGRLHQDIAAVADKVDFVMAGLPLSLKAERA